MKTPEIKVINSAYKAGEEMAKNHQKYICLNCWDAAKIALENGIIEDTRNHLESFLCGFQKGIHFWKKKG